MSMVDEKMSIWEYGCRGRWVDGNMGLPTFSHLLILLFNHLPIHSFTAYYVGSFSATIPASSMAAFIAVIRKKSA